MINLKQLTIKKAHDALTKKEYTSVDLAKAYLAEIEIKNSELHAYLGVYGDVLEQAKKEVCSPFFRLTFPFYCIFLILLTIVACLKWIFTGKYYYTADGKVMNFMKYWSRKINP